MVTAPQVHFCLFTLLTACRDGQPSRFCCVCAGWLYVEINQNLECPMIRFLYSDFCKALAHPGRYLLVSLHLFFAYNVIQTFYCSAGSFLPRLTTNGESFGATSPTGGQYGSVMIGASFWFPGPRRSLGLICLFNRFIHSRAWLVSWR
jgi:hypothetical protein